MENKFERKNTLLLYKSKEELADILIEKETQNNQLQQENERLKKEKQEFIEWLKNEIILLEDKTTHIFTDGLGKTIRVNDLIIEELQEVTYKLEGKE